MTFIDRSVSSLRGVFAALRRAVAAVGSPVAAASSNLLADYRLLGGLVGGAAVVALLAIPEAPRPLALLGVLIGIFYYGLASRRERHRQRLQAVAFPAAYREILLRRVPLYSQLDESERRRFEHEIQVFLSEQRIYALGGIEPVFRTAGDDGRFAITDEHRLLIAASAATLLLGRPEWRLPTERDIIVYPAAFTEESYAMEPYSGTVGMVHAQGPILFALDALERSYPNQPPSPSLPKNPWHLGGLGTHGLLPNDDGQAVLPHVGLHEFAHVLDFIGQASHGGRAHGVPGLLPAGQGDRWARQIELERERLLSGQSVLHPYGLKNEAELFAVSVESFFQEPLRVRAAHPELYELLAEFFNQDPAARATSRYALPVAYRPWFSLSSPVRYTA
jgi:Mlc titration factor MtfA (ptsG expression regulator)